MAMYGLSHTVNTRVGNDLIRGVSGGERKRVSIAECTLSMAPLQCWNNSTRGLDSATALEFIRTHPSVVVPLAQFAFTGALGQLFIFETLQHFGSLTLV